MTFAERYGPWAVIAGASEGTGRAFAKQIAAQGVNCILLARREGPLAQLAEEIRDESKVACVTVQLDLSAADAADCLRAAVGAREVGLFVANAGADANGALFLDRDADAWVELAQRNVLATIRCCHALAAPMRNRGRGGLLLVNSGACYGGGSFMPVYAGTKAFTLVFAEGLWAELQPHGVDVLTLVLGQTDTPELRKLLAARGMPVPANLASPDDVARAGLDRLAHGPVHNYGIADDAQGHAPNSAAARRERVRMVDRASRSIFGGDGRAD